MCETSQYEKAGIERHTCLGGAVAKLGGEQRRLSFSFPDGRCVWALLGRLEDPVDDHRVRVRLPVGSNIVPCPFRKECIASIPFNVRYADVRFLNAPFGPRIRFSRPWSPSRMLLRYFTCRCSTVGGQIPSDFNSAIALAREGALSVLMTRGDPAVVFDRSVLARKRFAAATFRFAER